MAQRNFELLRALAVLTLRWRLTVFGASPLCWLWQGSFCFLVREAMQTECTPGQSTQCAGVTGCVGAQVCNADGSGYGECTCGNSGYQVGSVGGNAFTSSSANVAQFGAGGAAGASSPTGYSPTGGQSTTASGGTPASNPSCVPASMNGQTFPAYIPARHMPGSCTEQAITDYYNNCYLSGECAVFMTGGPYETCGACLAPTELTASSLGPLLRVGTGSLPALETNVAGCEEILGEVACAPKMQIEFLCQYVACANNCPLNDYDSFNGLFQCMATAVTSQCASQHTAAQCLKSASDAAPCSGSSFQEQLTAVAKVFCL